MHDDLLARARTFDQAALSSIFDAYYGSIYRYIYFHTGHTQTAEDLSGQVFRKLLEKLRDGGGPDHDLKAWLFRVASNLIVDEARRAQHRDHLPLDEQLPAYHLAVEDSVEQALLLAKLRTALDHLTTSQRSIIILRYLLDTPNEEIAAIMQMTVGAVKAQQHRALTTLRRKFSEEGNREQST